MPSLLKSIIEDDTISNNELIKNHYSAFYLPHLTCCVSARTIVVTAIAMQAAVYNSSGFAGA